VDLIFRVTYEDVYLHFLLLLYIIQIGPCPHLMTVQPLLGQVLLVVPLLERQPVLSKSQGTKLNRAIDVVRRAGRPFEQQVATSQVT
jgi:hypothetical protein